MDRVQKFKTVLWSIVGLAAAVGITRFIFGLGVTTNLTDATPWGLWIGFDVMGGVALAAGGFVLTAIFYIFKREEFKPLVRPAVLTAFLGYLAVVGGLMFDLGLPWNIWHMIIYWNPHSPLFEVGWCVMLYTTVLLLEFSPVPLEEFSRYARIRNFLMKFRFPLVLLGIMLSTLHQSSLGSLFLIMPYKLPPLWYTPILPVQFFISAVALGLMMVSFESLFSHWLYRRKSEGHLIEKLGKIAIWVLGIYLVVKLGDIIIRGQFGQIFAGTRESNLFIIELLISAIIPMAILLTPRLRSHSKWQWISSFMVVFGMVFNRINVGGLTMLSTTGDSYIPSWTEVFISLGVVSAAALAFLFAIEKFHIWDSRPRDPQADPYTQPVFDGISHVWLGNPSVAARTRYSLAFVIFFAIGFALMPGDRIYSRGINQDAALPARGGQVLFIDGNRDNYGVAFNHQGHINRNNGDSSCVLCHHMNMPKDKNSRCSDCHNRMYLASDIFGHDWHAAPSGAKIKCNNCHQPGMQRNRESAKQCRDCHLDLVVPGSAIAFEQTMAPSYVDAMHIACVQCHKRMLPAVADKPMLDKCVTCHHPVPEESITSLPDSRWQPAHGNRVVLPGIMVEEGK
jgi:Ni/Fe-hydrogenase subunit HybB-like protein